jgi:hypothetical protein
MHTISTPCGTMQYCPYMQAFDNLHPSETKLNKLNGYGALRDRSINPIYTAAALLRSPTN